MPVLYGVMGFIVGAVGALIYNLIAGWIGGIELRLEPSPSLGPGITATYP